MVMWLREGCVFFSGKLGLEIWVRDFEEIFSWLSESEPESEIPCWNWNRNQQLGSVSEPEPELAFATVPEKGWVRTEPNPFTSHPSTLKDNIFFSCCGVVYGLLPKLALSLC